ncbi:glycine betaine/L-proline ABC transporter ATP-binding protein (plasmid) [Ensifer adhaerens]|uniref:Quaternary amine transport ATP-binding protein n=1 Tax=Ensifer adhaerens TaxID=106592 RepID=A0ABY8HTJ0_ENSAD|nr:glycine betaine/L-proline ABC transporter ATP-binding protein ProV [Ensifer adhaerens]ANK77407.1 glycine betaine/L-proline ABC transporter ATP-binding protein [Ensifer adhaerens]KDP72983.1 glycine/betaine ABC transporter ATPase [Ensifer adhaerens]WFP94674.1 glycine betaine/L-proline ABC transporter ATP-binding protein ProV [Ensifer adhaerens]
MAFQTESDRSADEQPVKISIKNVFKVFGERPDEALSLLKAGSTKAQIHAETGCTIGVNNATFDIRAGEIFVIMGLSGSGKSTMLRLLNRLIEPTSGSIEIDGKDVARLPRSELIALRRRDISMVFQSFALLPNRSVIDNAAFGLEVAGVGEAERKARARTALHAVGLEGYDDSRPDQLSGGMKQRVGLARALAAEPSVLLMDEAFSALDPLIRTEMQDELVRLQAEHSRTIVFVSHDLDEAMRIGDRICIMQNGEVVQVDTPDEIVLKPANDYVRSFFRNVDVSQVFRAGDVARKTQVTIIERQGVSAAAALERMEHYDREVAIILGRDKTYHGMISRSSLIATARDGAADPYRRAFLPDIEPIPASESLSNVLGKVAASAFPMPVIDEANRYLGSISKSALLETLDRTV